MTTGTWRDSAGGYVLSLPERVLRSVSALAGGLLKTTAEVTLPAALRRTRLYRALVDATLRFLVERVGEVEGVYPDENQLAEDFLLRRAAGNGLELLGILTFRASPVWILAALADLSGAGRHLMREISASLREEGLLQREDEPENVDQLLDALEHAAGSAADAINTPPLDVAGLRRQWGELRKAFVSLPRPGIAALESLWAELATTARGEGRSVFELSAAMALGAQVAAKTTGSLLMENLLLHYRNTLMDIRSAGFASWWAREFRPYLHAAARQFSRGKHGESKADEHQ